MRSGTRRRAEMPLRDEISKDIKFDAWVDASLDDRARRDPCGHLHVRSGADFGLLWPLALADLLVWIWVFPSRTLFLVVGHNADCCDAGLRHANDCPGKFQSFNNYRSTAARSSDNFSGPDTQDA